MHKILVDLTVADLKLVEQFHLQLVVFCWGKDSSNPNTTTIDYVQIMSLGDAVDFGDLLANRRNGARIWLL